MTTNPYSSRIEEMRKSIIPFNARGLWVALASGVLTFLFGSTIILLANLRAKVEITDLARTWARLLIRAAGCQVSVQNQDNIPEPGYLILANHQSFFDILAVLAEFPHPVRFVAKIELFSIPVFGRGMEKLGHIKIDRRNREAAKRSLAIAGERVRGGIPVLAFPEGTRNKNLNQLGPFKKGPFHLAVELQAPVLPVWIEGTGAVNPPGTLIVHPRDIQIRVGNPIEVTEFDSDIEVFMEVVREKISYERAHFHG